MLPSETIPDNSSLCFFSTLLYKSMTDGLESVKDMAGIIPLTADNTANLVFGAAGSLALFSVTGLIPRVG